MAKSGAVAVTTCVVHIRPPTPRLLAPFSYAKSNSRLKSHSIAIKSPSKPVCIRYKLGIACGCKDDTALSSSTSFGTYRRTGGGQEFQGDSEGETSTIKKRIFFLDVNPIRYNGSTPSLHSFVHWITLFFSQVSLNHPVVAVIDGERGNEYRRQLLPSYKAHRMKFSRQPSPSRVYTRNPVERSHRTVIDFLKRCNIPVIKVEGCEADDVVATLVQQVLQKGYKAVIASPDKDFKQLISEDVQLVIPLSDLGRWSFYTLKHYVAQYNCDPSSDLSLRCILGDEIDGVPGLQHVVPSFGRNTATKLLKKHGSLENLLSAAAVRTVGKEYVQEALTKYADFLLKNYQVLSLRRDIDVNLEDGWLCERDTSNDLTAIHEIREVLEEATKSKYVRTVRSSTG
ncbi:hypothetical protein V2J09_000762 [Rumex salicifolius]